MYQNIVYGLKSNSISSSYLLKLLLHRLVHPISLVEYRNVICTLNLYFYKKLWFSHWSDLIGFIAINVYDVNHWNEFLVLWFYICYFFGYSPPVTNTQPSLYSLADCPGTIVHLVCPRRRANFKWDAVVPMWSSSPNERPLTCAR